MDLGTARELNFIFSRAVNPEILNLEE